MEDSFYDVVVVGGGAGGVAAAVGAAQAGARVALLEKAGFLGGAATNSSVLAYCGFFTQGGEQIVRGVGQQFIDRLRESRLYRAQRQPYSGNTIVLLDRETTKRTLDSLVEEAGVDVYLHTTLTGAALLEGGDRLRIGQVAALHRGGELRLRAESFVDASGDAVLAAAAGAGLLVSPAGQRQGSTLVMHVGGVPWEQKLPAGADVAEAFARHRRETGTVLAQSNNVCVRSPVTGELMLLLADQHVDALDVRALSRAEMAARRQTAEIFTALRNHLPGWEGSYLSHTGPQIGIRETRRIEGRGQVVEEHIHRGSKDEETGVAKCGWPIEDHSTPGKTSYTQIGDDGWYHIGGEALASGTHENLWAAGRIISSDQRAYASVRVMGTAFATGQAAGIYAALQAAGKGQNSHAAVRAELTRQGADI